MSERHRAKTSLNQVFSYLIERLDRRACGVEEQARPHAVNVPKIKRCGRAVPGAIVRKIDRHAGNEGVLRERNPDYHRKVSSPDRRDVRPDKLISIIACDPKPPRTMNGWIILGADRECRTAFIAASLWLTKPTRPDYQVVMFTWHNNGFRRNIYRRFIWITSRNRRHLRKQIKIRWRLSIRRCRRKNAKPEQANR